MGQNSVEQKGHLSLPLLLDHDGYLPSYAYISDGKRHDSHMLKRAPPWLPAPLVTMDRGYTGLQVICLLDSTQYLFRYPG